jgi:uncharacterized protein YggE
VAPVPADEGSGGGSAVDWGAGAGGSLLEPVTVENAVTVIGTGTASVAPDAADVQLSVSVQRPTAAEARDEAGGRMASVVDALRNAGVADADLRTTILSLTPVYDWDDDDERDGGPTVVGYRMDNGVMVHVRDLEGIGAVIDDAVDAGATGVDGITFVVSDPADAEAAARGDAVADARRRAEALAEAAGIELGEVIAIGETQSSPVWPYSTGRSADEGGTLVEPGTAEISVSVQVAWAIR